MNPSYEQIVKTPTEARQGRKGGGVWKILTVSTVLAIIAMVMVGLIAG